MAQSTISWKTAARCYIIGFLVGLFFYLTPVLIERYYPGIPALAIVSTVCVWVTNTWTCGVNALLMIMAVVTGTILYSDAKKGIARLWNRRAVGPIALEDGTVEPVAAPAPAVDTTSAPTASNTDAKPTIRSKLVSFTACTFFFLYTMFLPNTGVVAFDRPVLENLASAALYILRGFEILFAGLLVLAFAGWVKKQRQGAGAAAPEVATTDSVTAPTEVLFVDAKEEKEILKEEEVTAA